jgi:hypothetical protein
VIPQHRYRSPGKNPDISQSGFKKNWALLKCLISNKQVRSIYLTGGVHTPPCLTPGQSVARAKLDLSLLSTNEAVGSWTLDLSLNEEPADQVNFTVEPLTGLVWWGPFVGVGLLVLFVVILGGLVIGGIVVLRRVFQGKKEI